MRSEMADDTSSREIKEELSPERSQEGGKAFGEEFGVRSLMEVAATIPVASTGICVLGQPVDACPRCKEEGYGLSQWKPHRHIGEMKIRYICERNFQELDSPHHFDIPLCPICSSVLYIYNYNTMIGPAASSFAPNGAGSASYGTRKLHRYALKCQNKHVLPLIDIFCTTKRSSNQKCGSNIKLQWSYNTMVSRCQSQKNRDHDLWWVRYKNEWKQRRTMIRYKKDFLSHLSESQRNMLLSLGLEGDPPPQPQLPANARSYDEYTPRLEDAARPPREDGGAKKKRLYGGPELVTEGGTTVRRESSHSSSSGSSQRVPQFEENLTPTNLATTQPVYADLSSFHNDLVTGTPIGWNDTEVDTTPKSAVSATVVGQIVCFPLILPLAAKAAAEPAVWPARSSPT